MTTPISTIYDSGLSASTTSAIPGAAVLSQTSEVAYFRAVAPTLTTPDALLSDSRALSFVTTAYGIAPDAVHTGLVAQLMSEDPTLPSSLAHQLSDINYLQFAMTFAHWAPPPFSSQATIDAAIAGFQQNTSNTATQASASQIAATQALSLLA